ncbi:MAG: cytochrome c biogenesis protein CcsA [Sulfuricaulis sp.]|uniref:cytochrome C assembly family protein n=1 Tax=Sulfuricaulis sp. TaxID=2003553 RepID=UPI0025E56F0D|nr:cytochrome c biogenesis protein CcsA [Sulfuricaulis sp.]MCR4345596.1 cytochrome c biogenesis protein CcsA [Sulfuricaulis sp.]
MTNPVMNFFALALYFIVGGLLGQRLMRGQVVTGGVKIGIFSLGLGAVVLHAALLYTSLWTPSGLNLALTPAFSLVAWVVATMYLSSSLIRPVDNLGVLIMPITGLTLLAEWLWPGQMSLALTSSVSAAHIIVSVLAYSLMCLAAVQSLMLLMQERHLRARHPGGFIRALPPVQTMESVMFQMIGFGFILLTLTLISGVFFSEAIFGQPLKFTHHMVLAVLAWIVYAILLIGRWRLGWRGRPAIHWTLGGFALLLLAYFGSKFVLEVLLHRG